jgi:hypothetical protein
VDKIALRIDREHLDIPLVESLIRRTEVPVGIFRLGGHFYAFVKPPLARFKSPLYHQVLAGLVELAALGAFSIELTKMISVANVNRDDFWIAIGLLHRYFVFSDFELAMDFYDLPLFRRAISVNDHPKGFIWKKTTPYTSDHDDGKRGGKAPNGTKGRQFSLLKIYDWTQLHGGGRQIWRLELRLQGKYRRYLSLALLLCNVPAVADALLPIMGKLTGKLINSETLVFHGHWLLPDVAPWWFRELLERAGWYETSSRN